MHLNNLNCWFLIQWSIVNLFRIGICGHPLNIQPEINSIIITTMIYGLDWNIVYPTVFCATIHKRT